MRYGQSAARWVVVPTCVGTTTPLREQAAQFAYQRRDLDQQGEVDEGLAGTSIPVGPSFLVTLWTLVLRVIIVVQPWLLSSVV